jgi:hypothetical protein
VIAILLFLFFCLSDRLLLRALLSAHLSSAPGIGLPLATSLLICSLVR